MINLMPDDIKKELRAARVNVLLIRYMTVLLLAFLFLVFILAGAYYILNQTRDNAQKLIESNDTKASVYAETKAQVDSLKNSLNETKNILDQEVLFSKVLVNFAQLMPAGTIIDEMTLDASSFGSTSMTLTVYAKSTNDAVELRDRFQNSPLFSNANFQTISENGGIEGYPVSVTMTLTLNRAAAQ